MNRVKTPKSESEYFVKTPLFETVVRAFISAPRSAYENNFRWNAIKAMPWESVLGESERPWYDFKGECYHCQVRSLEKHRFGGIFGLVLLSLQIEQHVFCKFAPCCIFLPVNYEQISCRTSGQQMNTTKRVALKQTHAHVRDFSQSCTEETPAQSAKLITPAWEFLAPTL